MADRRSRPAGPPAPAAGGAWTRVEHVMGTAVSISVAAGAVPAAAEAVEEAFAWLRRVDEVFSPFRPDSQVSRLRDGRLALAGCDPDVRQVLALCEDLRVQTGGYFDARAAGPGRLDPCGLVKGWAAERASDVAAAAGVAAHYVNRPGRDRLWRVGIADPHRPGHLLTTVHGSDLAVATSGTAERGAHVLDPHLGTPAMEVASVTVAGPSLALADAYATAAVAMGHRAAAWLSGLVGYEAFGVDADGGAWWTAGFPAYAPGLAAHDPARPATR